MNSFGQGQGQGHGLKGSRIRSRLALELKVSIHTRIFFTFLNVDLRFPKIWVSPQSLSQSRSSPGLSRSQSSLTSHHHHQTLATQIIRMMMMIVTCLSVEVSRPLYYPALSAGQPCIIHHRSLLLHHLVMFRFLFASARLTISNPLLRESNCPLSSYTESS